MEPTRGSAGECIIILLVSSKEAEAEKKTSSSISHSGVFLFALIYELRALGPLIIRLWSKLIYLDGIFSFLVRILCFSIFFCSRPIFIMTVSYISLAKKNMTVVEFVIILTGLNELEKLP